MGKIAMQEKIDIQSSIDRVIEEIEEFENYIERNKIILAENQKNIHPPGRLDEYVKSFILNLGAISSELMPMFLESTVYHEQFAKLRNDLLTADQTNRAKLKNAISNLDQRNIKLKHLRIKQKQDIEKRENDKKNREDQKTEARHEMRAQRDHEIQLKAIELKMAEANATAAKIAMEAAAKTQEQASKSLDSLIERLRDDGETKN